MYVKLSFDMAHRFGMRHVNLMSAASFWDPIDNRLGVGG